MFECEHNSKSRIIELVLIGSHIISKSRITDLVLIRSRILKHVCNGSGGNEQDLCMPSLFAILLVDKVQFFGLEFFKLSLFPKYN